MGAAEISSISERSQRGVRCEREGPISEKGISRLLINQKRQRRIRFALSRESSSRRPNITISKRRHLARKTGSPTTLDPMGEGKKNACAGEGTGPNLSAMLLLHAKDGHKRKEDSWERKRSIAQGHAAPNRGTKTDLRLTQGTLRGFPENIVHRGNTQYHSLSGKEATEKSGDPPSSKKNPTQKGGYYIQRKRRSSLARTVRQGGGNLVGRGEVSNDQFLFSEKNGRAEKKKKKKKKNVLDERLAGKT